VNTQRFLSRFADFGGAPTPEKYEQLFDPEAGTVLHPGMTAPLHRNGVKAYMEGYLATVRGFRFEIASWADRDGTVFVEAKNSGTIGGVSQTWGSVYCVTLRDDRVLRGRAYADRVPLLACLAPNLSLKDAAALGAPAPTIAIG
jgi:hypothetical protein